MTDDNIADPWDLYSPRFTMNRITDDGRADMEPVLGWFLDSNDWNLESTYQLLTQYAMTLKFMKELPSLDDVSWLNKDKAAEQTMALLKQMSMFLKNLTDAGEAGTSMALLNYPEFKLVLRLRRLGVSWAKIAETIGVPTPGLYKRYKPWVDAAMSTPDEPEAEVEADPTKPMPWLPIVPNGFPEN